MTRIDLRGADLSDVHPYLTGTGELVAELARLVADHNGVPPMLDHDDPFREVLRALPGSHRDAAGRAPFRSTAAFLEDSAEQLLGASGMQIPLPRTYDGLPQSVTVLLHAATERTGSGFARERVDARYEIRYSAGIREQARRDVRNLVVPNGVGLLVPAESAAAGQRPARWFGKPAEQAAPSPRWGTAAGATSPSPAPPARFPRWGVPAVPAAPPRPPTRGTRSFEDDLVSLVRKTQPTAGRDTILDTWKELKRIRGEASLPRNVPGRADAVAQALSIPRDKWDQVLRIPGRGPEELDRFPKPVTDNDLQAPRASSSARTLEDVPRVRWADEGGELETTLGQATAAHQEPQTVQEPPAAQKPATTESPATTRETPAEVVSDAVPVTDLLAATHVGIVGDRVVGVWLPGATDDAPPLGEEMFRRLTPPPDSVFVFGSVRNGRLVAGDRQIPVAVLAELLKQRAGGLAPVLWMPQAGELAQELAEALQAPVQASPYDLRFDPDTGTLTSIGPAHAAGAEDRSPDWFRLYQPDGEPTLHTRPELRVLSVWPEPEATPPPVDEVLNIDPAIRSIGIPRAGLPNLPELIDKLREQIPQGVTVPGSVWDLLPQRLLSNYSYLLQDPLEPGTRGLQVPLGPVEALIMLDPVDPKRVGNPPGSTMAPATQPAASDDDQFQSFESINGTYATGAHAQTRTATTSATRGSLTASAGIGAGPDVLHAARLGITVSGTANQSNRSNTNITDAEFGHIELNKSGSVLLNYTPNWSFKLRTDPGRRWRNIMPVKVPDPGNQKLMLWVPRIYLQRPASAQVTATGNAVKATELPSNIFASGLTAVPQLFDEIVGRLRGQGMEVPIGGSTRNELLQKLSNLDMHLNRAVNDKDRGYWFLLNDEYGRPEATIEVHAERVPNGNRRVGATSDKSGLEDVRTAIDGTGGSHELVNNSTLTGSLGFDLVPHPLNPDLGLGVSAYLSTTGTNTDAISAGRTGLWVLVPRYHGHTVGYYSKFVFSATVRVRDVKEEAPQKTNGIPGQALLRLTEPEAFEHGFPVDKEALKKDPGDRAEVPFEKDAIRQTGRRPGDPDTKPLPVHMELGKGIGTGLVKLSPATTQRIIDALRPILREKHFLPPAGDEYAGRHWYSHGNDLDSRLDNELLLEKIHGFSSFYDMLHQDGVPLVLRRRRGFAGTDWDVDTAKIVIKAKPNGQQAPRYVRTSDEFDTVNLAMGMDSAGQTTSGSLKAALGVSFKGLFRWLRGGLTNVEVQRTVGASDTLNYLNNRPELLAWAGSVDEWELTSDYEISVQFQHSGWQGEIRPGIRDPEPITLENETASAYVLPLNDGTENGPTSRFPTSVAALKQAVIYFADFSGMREAITTVLKELAGPQGAGDQDLDTLAGTIAERAHLKEILNGEMTTDQLVDPGFFRDTFGALDITGAMGKTKFVGSTDDPFVTGIIKLWLAQAGTSSSKSWGITWQMLNATFGGASDGADLSGAADISRRWQRSRSTNDTRTGGTELIQLDFNRVYAYATTIDFAIRALLEKNAKLLPLSKRVRDQLLQDRSMIFVLPEPEALAQYATTGLPVSNERLADALSRWRQGARPDGTEVEPLTLSGDVVAKILMRWATEVPQLPESLGIDRDALVRTLSELHDTGGLPVTDPDTREDFNRQFGTSLQDRANPLSSTELPEYLTREDPGGRVLGHHGVQDLKLDKGETTVKLVERKINEVAPGLLTRDPEIWNGKGRMIGKMQGGIDSLQAILARGRDEAMLEDVLDPEGMTFYVVNPVGWLLTDVVEIKLSAALTSQPDVQQISPKSGLENYGHGYVSKSVTRSREGGITVDYGRFAVGNAAGPNDSPADPPPSGSGTCDVRVGESHSRRTTRSEQATSEQTVYDFSGHYRTIFDIELTTSARRLDMSGRPINNQLLHWFERWTKHGAQATETVTGKLDLQVPRAIAEAGRQRGPAPLRHFTPLPELPHNAYILGTLFGDAYGTARKMADDIFGREHDDTSVTHLKSLRTRLLPTHVRNHLWEATVGGGYTLAEGIFMPGKSSHRATMELLGALYDMQVIGVVKEGTGTGTGTGMYVKHQSGTTATSNSGHWRSAIDLSATSAGTVYPHDPPHTMSDTEQATRATASGQSSGGTENYRRELHVKEQGPVVMVRLRGQFRIEADEFFHHLFGKPTKGAHFRSDPITGDVYALLDQAQIAELQAHLAESTRKARAAAAAWPAPDGAPAVDLGRLLTDAARNKYAAIRMYQHVARRIRAQAGGDRPAVLELDQAAFGAETLLSVLRWAERALADHLAESGADGPSSKLGRLIRTYRDIPPNAPENAITGLINAVNALHPGDSPRALPLEVPAFALDPVILARDIAHELQAHIRLDVTRPDGTTQQRWADSDGRVYVFDPLTFDDTTLSADLAQSAGLLPETLRRDVDDLDINALDLGRLYRTSWIHQRTFMQALLAEIHGRRSRLAALDPRLPELHARTADAARRSAAEVRSLEESQREVIRQIADARSRLEELDSELLELRTDLEGPWSSHATLSEEDAARARARILEAEQGGRERDLAALSGQDQDLGTLLWGARAYERDALRLLDDLKAAARETIDAERLEAARSRATSLLPAQERSAVARSQAARRQLTRQSDEAVDNGRRRPAGRIADSISGRLEAIESGIAAAPALRRAVSPVPSEGMPSTAHAEQDRIAVAYRRWAAGTTVESLDRVEGLLRDAGPGSLALVVFDETAEQFVAFNRDGEVRWVAIPTGAAATPLADSPTGAFLVLDSTGTLLRPPPGLLAHGPGATSFPELYSAISNAMQDRPGATRPAGDADERTSVPWAPSMPWLSADEPEPASMDQSLDTPPLTARRELIDDAWAYAPVHWLLHGAPADGVSVHDVMWDDPDGLTLFMANEGLTDAERVTRAVRTTGRGVESATALPAGLPVGTWIWFTSSEFTGAAVVMKGKRYLTYAPGIERTGLRSDDRVRYMIGQTSYTFVIARPVTAPSTSTTPSAGPARGRPRRVPPPTIDDPAETSAATPAAPSTTPPSGGTRSGTTPARRRPHRVPPPTLEEPATERPSRDPVREGRPASVEAPVSSRRFDPRKTTRGRTGMDSAAAVSSAESTDLLAGAIESGSLDLIVERLVERHPGPTARDVHESLAGLNLAGTRNEIVDFLLQWRGDFDVRALALLERVSRRAHGRSLMKVIPELPGLWLGWRVGFLVSRRMPSRAVEIIDQVRDRPAVLSSIVASQGRRRTGLILDLGIKFPDAGTLADDVHGMVQRGEHRPAARLLFGIEHDTLSLLALTDVYFTTFRRDIFVDVPALADAVRNVPATAPAAAPLAGVDAESGYDVAQLERALAGVSDDREIDFRVALKPTRLEGHRPFGDRPPVQVRNSHAWMEIRLPLGDPAQGRSYHGRVFSVGFWPDGPSLVTRSSLSVVRSPDTSEYPTAAVLRSVSADQVRRGIDFIRTAANRPYFWFGNSCLTFANELHSAVVGGRPFRGLASVAVRPARRDWLPAPPFPPPESLGDPEDTTTLGFPDNRSLVDETAHEAIVDLAQRYLRRLIVAARAGLAAPPVRITAFSGSSRPGAAPLSSRRAAAVRKHFLDVLEERLEIWLPARASQIARSEIPIEVRLLSRSGETAGQARVEVFAPRDRVRPGDAASTDDWLTSFGRSIGELRRPDPAPTTRRSGTSAPQGSSTRSGRPPAAAPAPAADGPRPPWFVAHGALGDGTVSRVDTVVDRSVDAWISEVTTGMKPAAAPAVRRRILALLAKKDAKTWERLLRAGTLIRRRGVWVKLTFSVEDAHYEPPGGEPAEEGLRTFFSKYGDTSYSEGSSQHRRRALSGRFEPLLFVIEGALSHFSPSVKVSAENEFGSGRSIAMEVQSGNRVIANETHDYTARIRVRATVNRRPGPELLLPGAARLAFPKVYSSAAEVLAPPAAVAGGGHPTVRVADPGVLHGLDHAVNAVAPQALTAGLRAVLEARGLPAEAVDGLVQEASDDFFNEKTLKDRSQWWLTGSWVSSVLTAEMPGRSDFQGHLEVSGTPHTVRYVTTTEQEVLLRNDIADTALIRDGGEHHSKASVATALAGGVEVGEHLITPGVELPMVRSSSGQSHTVVSEGQAKNAIMRKDRLVRYLTEFTMVVTVRSTSHGAQTYTVPILGELGIGRAHAAYFERLALAGPTGSGLEPPQDVPVPVAEPALALALAPELPEPLRASRAQRLERWLTSRFAPEAMPMPWPYPAIGLRDVDDLLKLADRRPIEIAVPPELHDLGAPRGPLASGGWVALRAYDNVSWLFQGAKTAVLSHGEEHGPASWRYVLDGDARVVGALRMAQGKTSAEGRWPEGYVPNPAVPPVVEPPVPRPKAWYESVLGPLEAAGLRAVAGYLRAGGVPQIQLTDAMQARVATAAEGDPLRKATRLLKDTPQILVVAGDGSRLSTEDRPDRRTPEARFLIEEDGGVRGPLPVWHHVVHPAEPIELAARKGLGLGILRETPGLERLFRDAQNALAHQMRSAGVEDLLSATDRQHLARVLAMKFGVPGLRGAYRALIAVGVGHEVRLGGYVFSVAADAQLRELRRDPVAEGGVSLDNQHKGVAAVSTAEQIGIEVGAEVSGRFRAKFSKLFSLDIHAINVKVKRSWTRKIIDTTGVKEYRRVRTNGDVTRFEYETVYTLTVTTRRPAGAVQAAYVRELSGKDYWAAVTVSNAFLPETPIPPDDIVALGEVTVVDLPDDGGPGHGSAYGKEAPVERPSDPARWAIADLGPEFDLNVKGLSGLQVRLIGTEVVTRHLAEMVAAHNGVPWLSEKGDAFRQILAHIVPTGSGYGVAERILRTGTPTFLEALARRMLRKGRLRIPLPPTADGWQQEVTIWLRTFGVRHEKSVTDVTQEQYTEADLRFGEEDGVSDSVDASGGAGAVFRIGPQPAAEGESTTSQKASSQVSFGGTGGAGGSRGRYTGDMGGGLDLNLGTYSGASHSFGANAVYELVHRRWRDGETRSAKRVLGLRHGVTLLAPHVRATDHGLPVPPAGRPPVEHQERHPVDRELAMAVAYIEDADAAGVLPAIEDILGDVDPEVLRAVRSAFDEEAVRAEYPIARSGGIHQVITSPAKFWRDRTLWEYFKIPAELGGTVRTGIRVVVEEGTQSYRRPRPDVRVTTGGQAFAQTSRGSARSSFLYAGAYVHGRWAGTGEGSRAAGGAHLEYEAGRSSKQGSTTTIRDIRRATAKDGSQEFTGMERWRVEVYQHISPNELFHQAGRAVGAVPRLVEVLSRGESLRMWQRLFPPGREPLGTRRVEVRAAALVPEHLTTTMPVDAAPPGRAIAVISRAPAPEPSPLARVLARYVHALPMPGSGQLPPWVPAAAVPWRRIDPQALTRGTAPDFEDFAPATQDRFTIELALTERNLRANIAALLRGTYRIPLLDGTALTVQMVPTNGRWITRGGYSGFNFPEDSTEPERETEVRHGWGYGFDLELGHPVGKPLAEGAETPLFDGGPANDRGRETVRAVKENSTGDYVESNIQRDGDYDYYRFDAEFVISGPHGHTVSVQIANGFIGMLPSVVLSRVGSLQGLGPARPATPTETETESVSDTESESDTDASTTHAAVDPSDLPHREPDTGRRVVRSTPPVPSAPVSGRYDRAVPPAFLDKPRPPSRKAVRGPTTGGRAAGVPRFDVDPDGIVYASSRRSAFGPDGRLLPPEERRCVQVAAVLRQPRPACS